MAFLDHSLVVAPGASPSHWMYFLHGILGNGSNWRAFARRLTNEKPELGAVLVDLPMHGNSQPWPGPYTLDAAAEALHALEAKIPGPIRFVLGHSFGGKVALAYARDKGMHLEQGWILDSTPSRRTGSRRGSDAIEPVLSLLASVGRKVPSRAYFLEYMQNGGLSPALAQWLAMNLRYEENGLVVRVELAAIRSFLEDYFAQELWSVLEAPAPGMEFRLVVGGKSEVFDEADRVRAAAIHARVGSAVRIDVLPEAGHWLHVDAPEELFSLVKSGLILTP